jgi:pseudoazurin|tara:strand:+ start:166 stop:606 length:441 start_codon:yes stop_codon:yes gene_type:complete
MSEFLILKIVAAWLLVSLSPAFASNVDVEMLNKRDDGAKMVYSLDIVDVEVGDTVTWLPTAKGHNVQFIAGPNSATLPKKSKLNKEFTQTFDVPGIYLYQCTPHKSMGMIGIIVVGKNTNNKEAIASTKVNGKSKKKLAKLLSELD